MLLLLVFFLFSWVIIGFGQSARFGAARIGVAPAVGIPADKLVAGIWQAVDTELGIAEPAAGIGPVPGEPVH